MDIGPTELIIILLIVVLLFGVGRISKVAGEMGSGIRAFKKALTEDEDQPKPDGPNPMQTATEPAPPAQDKPDQPA